MCKEKSLQKLQRMQCRSGFESEYIKQREYAGRRWLVSPSESLLSCISGVQDITNEILKKIFLDFDFLKCEEHKNEMIDYVINLSCRFFIYNYCKDINKILIGKRDLNDDEDTFQMKAIKHYRKCAKRH
ncbi:Uncharacterized protein OBRU01_25471, partial [Operophtera brumata]